MKLSCRPYLRSFSSIGISILVTLFTFVCAADSAHAARPGPAICLKKKAKGRSLADNGYIGKKGKCRKGYYTFKLAGLDQGPAGAGGGNGIAGIDGSEGPTGPAGSQGAPGYNGETGAQGPQGPTGPQGPQGEVGPQGPPGEAGQQGPKGETGASGATGPQGATGPDGATGPQGTTGPQGDKGPTGADGTTGPIGATGPQGQKGDTGSEGPAGTLTFTQCTNVTLTTGEKSGSIFQSVDCPDPALNFMLTYSWSATTDVTLRQTRVVFDSGGNDYAYPVGVIVQTNNQGSTKYSLSVTAVCCPLNPQ